MLSNVMPKYLFDAAGQWKRQKLRLFKKTWNQELYEFIREYDCDIASLKFVTLKKITKIKHMYSH